MDRFAHYGWPFFDPRHLELAREAERWAAQNLGHAHGEDADAICKRLVQDLGCAGYLRHCATERADVRSVALLREVLAYHAGLADFAFAEMARAHEEWVIELLAGLSRKEHDELLRLLAKLKASTMEVVA